MSKDNDPFPRLGRALGVLANVEAAAIFAFVLWTSIVIWQGGDLPLLGSHVDASPLLALLTFFVGLPVLASIVVFLTTTVLKLVLAPLFLREASRR